MVNSDDRLKGTYAAMLARRSTGRDAPDVPVETLQALADGSYTGVDRAELLETVLADARTAAEFQFFLDLAREKPRVSTRRNWMAAAAMLVIALGTVAIWRASNPPAANPLRSDTDILAAPAAGADVPASAAFIWKRVPEAEDYRFELVAEDGSVVHEATTSDTTLTLPAQLTVAPGTHVWWVTTRMRDGSQDRSPSRPVRLR